MRRGIAPHNEPTTTDGTENRPGAGPTQSPTGSYDRSIAAIAPGGRIAQIGVLTGFASQPNILPLQFKNAGINGICVGSVQHFEHLNRFLSTHRIQPVIDKTFAFDEVPAAFAHLKSAGHFGKVVIELS